MARMSTKRAKLMFKTAFLLAHVRRQSYSWAFFVVWRLRVNHGLPPGKRVDITGKDADISTN